MQFDEGGYSIGEIAARTGLTADALRYYERLQRESVVLLEQHELSEAGREKGG